MTRFSPKIEIINHFDNLINRVDIDIDVCLSNYNDNHDLSKLLINSQNDRRIFKNEKEKFNIDFFSTFNSSKHQCETLDLWPESTKVVDYLNQVRMRTIEELRKAQEETLEYYKINSSRFKSKLNINDLKSELFAEKFYFQIHFTKQQLWAFNVFTFVTDFYISPSHIDSLE